MNIAGVDIAAGDRASIELPVGRMPTQTMIYLPVRVVRGARDGAVLWLTAAIHGDELNGVEITRKVLDHLDASTMAGTVIAVPIVNVYGFMLQSRYLPDRRDLNRSFPGSARGSLAARLANLLMKEIVEPSDYGIDLHTAATGRMNLPQIRCDLEDAESRRCAAAFGAPLMIHSKGPQGTLRRAARERGKHALVYEAGEVLRYNPVAIDAGVHGVLAVMSELGMIERPRQPPGPEPISSYKQTWVRAPRGGIVHMMVELGEEVTRRQVIAEIADPFGETAVPVRAPRSGIVIGGITNPLVHRGDAVLHLAVPGDKPPPPKKKTNKKTSSGASASAAEPTGFPSVD